MRIIILCAKIISLIVKEKRKKKRALYRRILLFPPRGGKNEPYKTYLFIWGEKKERKDRGSFISIIYYLESRN